jgi:hypothetical protein
MPIRAHLENVRLIGFQDTLHLNATSPTQPARAFFDRVYVEGDMDFIFGEATAFFRASEIRTLGDRAISYTLAPSTHVKQPPRLRLRALPLHARRLGQRARRILQARAPVESRARRRGQGRDPAFDHRRAHRRRAAVGGLEHRHAALPAGAI